MNSETQSSSWTSPWFRRGGGTSGTSPRSPSSPWWNRGSKTKSSFALASVSGSLDATDEPRRTVSTPNPQSHSSSQKRRSRPRRSGSVGRAAEPASGLGRVGQRPPVSARSTSTVDLKMHAKRLVSEAKQLAEERLRRKDARKAPDAAATKAAAERHREWVRNQKQAAAEEGRLEPLHERLFYMQAAWAPETSVGGAAPSSPLKERAEEMRLQKPARARMERGSTTRTAAPVEDLFRPPTTMSGVVSGLAAARPELPGAVEQRLARRRR